MFVRGPADEPDQLPQFQGIKFSRFKSNARRSVFIVGDSDVTLDVLPAVLSKAGWTPKVFSDGHAFVRAVVDTFPDLCIIDLAIPDYDGVDILKALALGGYEGDLLFMSAHGPQTLRCVRRLAEESNLNVRGCLAKPFTRAQLLEIIDANKKGAFTVTGMSVAEAIRAGQISALYEPIVDVRTGRVVAAEALARWRHPTEGSIPPDEFVSKLDAEGLRELTLHVLRDVLERRQQLQQLDLAIELHINIPAITILELEFKTALFALSGNSETCLKGITAELTETDAVTNTQPLAFALGSLALHGLKVAVDDFGTGHSSLAQLQKLPVHMMKVDRSFVLQCATHVEDRAIIKAIVALGVPSISKSRRKVSKPAPH